MSAPLDRQAVLFQQRILCASGLLTATEIDGAWGPKTDAAAHRLEAIGFHLADQLFPAGHSGISWITRLWTLVPEAQACACVLLAATVQLGNDDHPFEVRIASATRTYEEQDALYAKGRTAPGAIVTHARAGFSWHNFGLAWDVGCFRDGAYLPDGPEYDLVAEIAAKVIPGVTWGGSWSPDKRDRPHYQLLAASGVGEIKTRFEAGTLDRQALLDCVPESARGALARARELAG